jgi:ribosome modulation factor
MPKFGYTGMENAGNDPLLARAYCEGRRASVAGSLITTCPHAAGTAEYTAWRSGWYTYAASGTIVEQDGCDLATKAIAPVITIANVGADTTGATYSATTAAGAGPNRIDWGDGTSTERQPGDETPLTHKYAASGTYKITSHYLGAIRDTKTQAVTVTPAVRVRRFVP